MKVTDGLSFELISVNLRKSAATGFPITAITRDHGDDVRSPDS